MEIWRLWTFLSLNSLLLFKILMSHNWGVIFINSTCKIGIHSGCDISNCFSCKLFNITHALIATPPARSMFRQLSHPSSETSFNVTHEGPRNKFYWIQEVGIWSKTYYLNILVFCDDFFHMDMSRNIINDVSGCINSLISTLDNNIY